MFFLSFLLIIISIVGALWSGYDSDFSRYILSVLIVLGILRWSYGMLRDLMSGRVGVDIIAIAAMVVSLVLGQVWPGVVILLMLTLGQWLEVYALRRARGHVAALLNNAPTQAHVKRGKNLHDVRVDALKVGERVVVKPGEVVPVDGVIEEGASMIDEARLTGESLPVDKTVHDRVLAGSVNLQGLLVVRVMIDPSQTQYSRMVELVRQAEANQGRLVRLADRYTLLFTLITAVIACVAWFVSHDWIRVLSVLVVATPCPLILATPIAVISGVSRCAGKGIVVKGGGPLEELSRVNAMVFDKTGTLTFGSPTIKKVWSEEKGVDVLKIAASLDQGSTHVLANALTATAKEKKKKLHFPKHFVEVIGMGVSGKIGLSTYHFGRKGYLEDYHNVDIPRFVILRQEHKKSQGVRTVYLARGKEYIGAIEFVDQVKPGLKALFQDLRVQGIRVLKMLTGDKKGVAQKIATRVGLKDICAECLPEEKAQEIKKLQVRGYRVAMIGDGLNDAPSLVLANVGIAMGTIGSSVSSEAADIVITDDAVEKVGLALRISKYAISIAKQGIWIGIGVSTILMIVATFGVIPPILGSVLQEVLDVVVIVNALRVHSARIMG